MRILLFGLLVCLGGCGSGLGWFAAGVAIGTQIGDDQIIVNVEHEHGEPDDSSRPPEGRPPQGTPPGNQPPHGVPPGNDPGDHDGGDAPDNPDHGDGDDLPSDDRTTICHRPDCPDGRTIEVAANAVEAHLAHGDTLGACE